MAAGIPTRRVLGLCALGMAAAVSFALASAASAPRPTVSLELPREAHQGEQALATRKHELGLVTGAAGRHSCAVTRTCPDGRDVSCSVHGRLTDCGPLHDARGTLTGVACLGFRVVAPGQGYVATDQQACR